MLPIHVSTPYRVSSVGLQERKTYLRFQANLCTAVRTATSHVEMIVSASCKNLRKLLNQKFTGVTKKPNIYYTFEGILTN